MVRSAILFTLMLAGCGPTNPAETAGNDVQASVASAPRISRDRSSGERSNPAAATPAPGEVAPLTADGWGPLRIDMTLAEVIAAAGPDSDPDAVGGPEPEICDQFRPSGAPEGLLVMIEDGRLSRISIVEGTKVKTDRGLVVGDRKAKVTSVYGTSVRETPHTYEDAPAAYLTVWQNGNDANDNIEGAAARGMVYEVDSSGRVGAIHAGGSSIRYVEGCA